MKEFDSVIMEIEIATALGDEIKKVIPKNTDNQKVIIALAYLASDIAKEAPDFKKRKKEIIDQIESCFELWGNG